MAPEGERLISTYGFRGVYRPMIKLFFLIRVGAFGEIEHMVGSKRDRKGLGSTSFVKDTSPVIYLLTTKPYLSKALPSLSLSIATWTGHSVLHTGVFGGHSGSKE